MTHNQIDYWNLIEAKRANSARESENFRHNQQVEDLTRQANSETQRHNEASEMNERNRIAASTGASNYAAQLSSAATRYAADLNYRANIYNTNVSASNALTIARERNASNERMNAASLAQSAENNRLNARINYVNQARTISSNEKQSKASNYTSMYNTRYSSDSRFSSSKYSTDASVANAELKAKTDITLGALNYSSNMVNTALRAGSLFSSY